MMDMARFGGLTYPSQGRAVDPDALDAVCNESAPAELEVFMSTQVDRSELESKVQAMYCDVAENPHGEFHFEMGRALAERLGYPTADLDLVPAEAIDSFAGVGYFFHLLDEMEGARVLDLGSGSGMDTFVASLLTGPTGMVIGPEIFKLVVASTNKFQAAFLSWLRRCGAMPWLSMRSGFRCTASTRCQLRVRPFHRSGLRCLAVS